MVKILITGNPGTGKTTLCLKVLKETKIKYLNTSDFIKKNKLYNKYSKKYDAYEYDNHKVMKFISKELDGINSFIVDTHAPDLVQYINFDYIFLIRCNPGILRERYLQRNYSTSKIEENIECEIFNEIGMDLEDFFPQKKIIIINNSEETVGEGEIHIDEAYNFILNLCPPC